MRVVNPHAEPASVTQLFFDEVPQMVEVDHHLGDSVSPQESQCIDDQRAVPDEEQRLGGLEGEGAEACPEAGGKDDCLHERNSGKCRFSRSFNGCNSGCLSSASCT